ncbi:tyrosine decarboxylase [Hortaea werneckii]|nr:tyrosine decarboxylase [Hortaea werneckii]KAI7491960.1 tyrosine decarboxylase [Hortaea werneckii]KAI7503152.1 tyrosine decarboxylase [Hortaea werneckii]
MDTNRTRDTSNLVLPSAEVVESARANFLTRLPDAGIGEAEAIKHLNSHVLPGLNKASSSPHYYGFVTGGATTIARLADNLVTEADNSPQVHLPRETVATEVEDCALRMVCDLLALPSKDWPHRTFTTGATASNVVGIACGREFVIQHAANKLAASVSVGDDGLVKAMAKAGVSDIQILTTVPHSSLRKASSIVGLGRSCVIEVGKSDRRHLFDMEALESQLRRPGIASIVVVSCAEVNTGFFATTGEDMRHIRKLCDEYGAWLHVDAAFGLLARALSDSEEYSALKQGVNGLELADSIAGDAHKLLNVPYDCGIFLSRHLGIGVEVFQNSNAAYLNSASSETIESADRPIPSPLNIGIENSRRFRALPVYGSLAAYGRTGYREMLERQIRLAREIARFIAASEHYELLPNVDEDRPMEDQLSTIYIIVLFRAKSQAVNEELVKRVNATKHIYISGTQWEGRPAARFAVANWQADAKQDLQLVQDVLLQVVHQ